MGDEVVAAIVAANPGAFDDKQIAQLKVSWEAACTAIIAHLLSNQEITVSGVFEGDSTLPVEAE